MTQVSGLVTNVYAATSKSELIADHALGATTLQVYDAYAFEPLGGIVEVNGTQYTYTAVDLEANTLTITPGLTAAATADDAVLVVPYGKTLWASIDADDDDEGFRAVVPFSMKDRLVSGIRDGDEQEHVIVSDATGRWQVESLDEEIVIITGTVFQTTDGLGDAGVSGMMMSDDPAGGVLKAWTGDPTEVGPAWINPQLDTSTGTIPQLDISGPHAGGHRSHIYLSDDQITLDPNSATGEVLINSGDLKTFNGEIWANGINATVHIPNSPTTTSAANVRKVGVGGALQEVTSLSKFKLMQEPLSDDAVRGVLALTPITWYDIGEVEENGGSTDGLRRIPGLTAEDVERHVPELAMYDHNGDLRAVAYDRVGPMLIPIVRAQADKINDLENRLDTLERLVGRLTSTPG